MVSTYTEVLQYLAVSTRVLTWKYCVEVLSVRIADNVFLSDKMSLQYSLFHSGQRINIDNFSEGYVKIYTFTGQLLCLYNITSDSKDIFAPQETGFYLLRVISNFDSKTYKIKVK